MTPQEEQAAAIGQLAKQSHRAHLSALWALIERKGTSTARIGPIAEELKIDDIDRARRAMERLLDLGVIARDGPDTFKPLPWRHWRDRSRRLRAAAALPRQAPQADAAARRRRDRRAHPVQPLLVRRPGGQRGGRHDPPSCARPACGVNHSAVHNR